MKLSALLEPLVAAGVDAPTILAAVKAWEEQQIDALERRRANDRERQERRRHVTSRDVTVTVSSHAGATRVEDNNSIQRTPPKKTREGNSAAKRGRRLGEGEEMPPDFEALAVEAGLPVNQVERTWQEMRDWSLSSPNGAKLDWAATWRNWCRRKVADMPKARAGPPAKQPHISQLYAFMDAKESEVEHPEPLPQATILHLPAAVR